MTTLENLKGLKVAILITDGFEYSEMTEPKNALEKLGVQLKIISPNHGDIKSWKDKNWGPEFKVDVPLSSAKAEDFHALILPGGVMNPDKLRIDKDALLIVKGFLKANKPIAAICHAPWVLISAGAVSGKKITSWPSLESDLKNAGAHWVDQEVIVDGNLITSRKPADLPAFIDATIQLLSSIQVKQ